MPRRRDIALFGMISRHPGMNRGGVSVSAARLANALDDAGTRVVIITAEAACTEAWRAQLNDTIAVLPCRRLSRLWLTCRLALLLRRYRPAGLLAIDQRAGLIAARATRLAGVDTRLYWSPRIAVSEQSRHDSAHAQARRLHAIQSICRRATGVITVSRAMAEDLACFAALPERTITTIHNPVVDGAFYRRARARCPSPPLIPKDRKLLVTAGRLTPQKDYVTLLKAFQKVNQQIPAFLLILGEGAARPALERLIDELAITPWTSLPGYTTNPLPYIRRAAVFALSSRYEGLPNTLIEALALGTPVVSTDCPTGPAEILAHGRYGRLTPVGDSAALANALISTLTSPSNSAELRRAARPYRAPIIAAQYRELMLSPRALRRR